MKAILPDDQEVAPEPFGMLNYGTDEIDIGEAFENGIPLKGHDRRLQAHVLGNHQSAFRGTTSLANINPALGQGAVFWADVGGWVYEIGPMLGWNPEKLLAWHVDSNGRPANFPHAGELETSVPSRIEPHQIYKAGQVEQSARTLVVRKWIYNPNYQPKR